MYVGSSPAGQEILQTLGIDRTGTLDLIEWHLLLRGSERSGDFDLQLDYGRAANGSPGLDTQAAHTRRQGTWTSENVPGIAGRVLRLAGGPDLVQVTPDVLHVLNVHGTLMVGDGGWSYTLSREPAAEPIPDPAVLASQPDMSYRLLPLATGADTFGVFEGRTPCRGIAALLAIVPPDSCVKVKWRITLSQDPESSRPTRYRIEGSLHRQTAREGTWSMTRATLGNTVIRLAATAAEAEMQLLVGDADVLFILDDSGHPIVGHALHSYTLNHRTPD